MEALIHLIEQYGLLVVFVAVLLDQGGIPVPAYPAIMVASALAAESNGRLWPIALIATTAAVLADSLWFVGGRHHGRRLIRWICRLSLSPESCIGTTRDIYDRWGARSLVVAKFVPGFAAVATTVAGQSGTSAFRFMMYDGLGALIWASVAVFLGALFHDALNDALAELEALGHWGLAALLAAITVFVAYKAWTRQRFIHEIRMARITPQDLHRMMEQGDEPLVLDVRSALRRDASGWIPGAVFAAQVAELDLAPQHEVIVYCDCPNEASAAQLALQLKARGFQHVRPLAGGFEAWAAIGLPVARPDALDEKTLQPAEL